MAGTFACRSAARKTTSVDEEEVAWFHIERVGDSLSVEPATLVNSQSLNARYRPQVAGLEAPEEEMIAIRQGLRVRVAGLVGCQRGDCLRNSAACRNLIDRPCAFREENGSIAAPRAAIQRVD